MTRYTTIRLSELAGQIEPEMYQATDWDGAVEYVDALRPGDEPEPVIVCNGCDIVDGFHRTAGWIAWALERGLDLREVEVRVVDCDDQDLITAAAEPGGQQREALDAIYALI